MDFEEACDRAEEIEFSMTGDRRLAALRREIDALAVGETGRAMFLCSLAEFLGFQGRWDEAREAYRNALSDGGRTIIDPRIGLLDIDVESGEHDRIDTHLPVLLQASRDGELSDHDCEWIGEALEEADRLKDAHRWFTIPLRDIDPDDIGQLPIGCINGRYRVRRDLELPMDKYDEATFAVRDLYRAARGLDD